MKDSFSRCHPGVNFVYYIGVLICTMLLWHPAYLSLSFASALAYQLFLKGKEGLSFLGKVLFPLLVCSGAVNGLFTHYGVTVLCTLPGGNALTLEALAFGLAAGAMMGTVLLWFSNYNVTMTNDKLLYLTGRAFPSLSLFLSVGLRLTPRYLNQAKRLFRAQKGLETEKKSFLEQGRQGVAVMSALTGWAMENSLETADSMRSRGYGLPGRTSFFCFSFSGRDRGLLALEVFCLAVMLAGGAAGLLESLYDPVLQMAPLTGGGLWCFLCYGVFLNIPLGISLWEGRKWKGSR